MGIAPPAPTSCAAASDRRCASRSRGCSTPRDPAVIEHAIALYRERYADVGWRENEVYDGIEEALPALARRRPCYVCTSKPEIFARRIVTLFGLSHVLRRVYGADLAGALDDKARLFAHAARSEGVDPEAAIMIGDRAHDVRAARMNGATRHRRSLGLRLARGAGRKRMPSSPRPRSSTTPIAQVQRLFEASRGAAPAHRQHDDHDDEQHEHDRAIFHGLFGYSPSIAPVTPFCTHWNAARAVGVGHEPDRREDVLERLPRIGRVHDEVAIRVARAPAARTSARPWRPSPRARAARAPTRSIW